MVTFQDRINNQNPLTGGNFPIMLNECGTNRAGKLNMNNGFIDYISQKQHTDRNVSLAYFMR